MIINLLHRRRVSTTIIRGAKIALFVLPIFLLGWLVNENYLLTPSLTYTYRPGELARVVAPKAPTQLLKTADPKLRWQVAADNFLFHVTIPRLIEAVRVRVRLDPGTQPYTTLTADAKTGAEVFKIINAASLNTLNWKHVSKNGLSLWMRDKHITKKKVTTGIGKKAKTETVTVEKPVTQYDSVDAFRADPPNMDTVGLVGIERMTFATVKNYQPTTNPISLGHALRGSHQFYVYAANETLKMTFDKIDLNRSRGDDILTVRVARADDLKTRGRIWIKTIIVGEAQPGEEGKRGSAQPVVIEIPNAAPGVYVIDINTNEDVLLTKMTSFQRFFAFSGRVFIAEGPAYAENIFTPVSLQTNGSTVTVAANHEQGKQDVVVAGKRVAVKDVKVNHVVSQLGGTTTIEIPKGDIIVSSDGLLSFKGFELLSDGARDIDISTVSPDLTTFDYILADYVPPQDGKIEVDQTYKLDDLDLKNKTLTFSLDSPGMQTAGTTLGLKDIRVTLIRGSFPWDKIWKKFGLK